MRNPVEIRLSVLVSLLLVLAGCAHYTPRTLRPEETADYLQSRKLSNDGLRAFLAANQPEAMKEWPLKSWNFEGSMLAALYYHPSLEVARADWEVARAGIKTAGGRLNPTVSVDVGYDAGIANSFSPWMPAISFDVPIETAGKRQRRIEHARNLSESARLGIVFTAWQVRNRVRSALLDFVSAQERSGLLAEEINLQQQLVDRLRLQLQAGAIGTAELAIARTALAKAIADAADIKRTAAGARVRLADAIGVPVTALEGVAFTFDISRTTAGDALTSSSVRDAALHSRTDILAALAEYAAAQSALQLEIAKQYPDVHLSPAYLWNQQNEGDHGWQLGVTVELPVLNRNQGPIAEAEAHRKATAARIIALQAKVIAEIDGAIAAYNASQDNLDALESLVAAKQAQRDLTAAQTKAGAADRLQLLGAELELSTAAMAEFDGRVQLQQSFGALEDAIQRPFELPRAIYETKSLSNSKP